MTHPKSPDSGLNRLVRGLYLMTLIGIGVAGLAASQSSGGSSSIAWMWILQAGVFLGVLRVLGEATLALMDEVDHE